jgi:hypothetical protein
MAGTKHRDPVTVCRANIERHQTAIRHWRKRLKVATRRAAELAATETSRSPEARP